MEEEIHRKGNHIKLIISLFLVLITLAVFWQVQDHAFLNLDDDLYSREYRVEPSRVLRDLVEKSACLAESIILPE